MNHSPKTIAKIREKRALQIMPKGKDSPNYGKKLPLAVRRKMSLAKLGKPKSDEHKKNISLSKIGSKNPQFGKPAWNRGLSPSESTREKISEARLFQDITHDSKVEKILHAELERRGIEFQKNIPIFGRPDVFIYPDICIFVDGYYDHANPQKYNPDDKIRGSKIAKEIWKYDTEVTECLREMGLKVFRFWSHEVENNLESCVDKILDFIDTER